MISHFAPAAYRNLTARVYCPVNVVTHFGSVFAHAIALSANHIEIATDAPLATNQRHIIGIELDAGAQQVAGNTMIYLEVQIWHTAETASTTVFSCRFTKDHDTETAQTIQYMIERASFTRAPLPWERMAA